MHYYRMLATDLLDALRTMLSEYRIAFGLNLKDVISPPTSEPTTLAPSVSPALLSGGGGGAQGPRCSSPLHADVVPEVERYAQPARAYQPQTAYVDCDLERKQSVAILGKEEAYGDQRFRAKHTRHKNCNPCDTCIDIQHGRDIRALERSTVAQHGQHLHPQLTQGKEITGFLQTDAELAERTYFIDSFDVVCLKQIFPFTRFKRMFFFLPPLATKVGIG